MLEDRDGCEEAGMTVKGQREFFSGNGTILYLDCGGDYTNLYIVSNCIDLYTHTDESI